MSSSIHIVGRQTPVELEDGATLLDAVLEAGFSVPADCGGKGKCGRCKVKIVAGAWQVPPNDMEIARLGKKDVEAGFRFACSHEAADGIVLDVVEEIYRQEVYKQLGIGIGKPLPLNPAFRQIPLSEETLEDALAGAGLSEAEVDWDALLPDCSEPRFDDSDGRVHRVVLKSDTGRVFALFREPVRLYGVAVDLGTTTIAAYLCDFRTGEILGVETARNPQVSFGADVMSRIVASQRAKEANGLKTLASETISACIANLCKRYGIFRENLVEGLVVGNPTMIHLLLGAPARGLGLAPYRPIFHRDLDLLARDLGLPLHRGALLHTLPLPSAFVGADTLAAWLWAERTYHDDVPTLLLDLGTNGEMILSAGGRLWGTSCATGPAFEGATLSCGMQGMRGAVERVHFDGDRPVLDVIGGSADPSIMPRGICGSGAMSVLAGLLKNGVIRPDGRFNPDVKCEYLRSTQSGVEFVLFEPEELGDTDGLRPVTLHQKDVRELQFAKGAVATGIRFLCDAAGIEAPGRILLAGAFGNVIQPDDALGIGLIPEIDPKNIIGIGNAAGLGACLALLDTNARERARVLRREVEVIDLGGAPGFKNVFFKSLAFPGKN